MISDDEREKIRRYLEGILGHKVLPRKIRAIGINPLYHGQLKRIIEVGKFFADLEPGTPAEEVIAIFETKLFCICTPGRGDGRGLPYLVTRESVFRVDAPV